MGALIFERLMGGLGQIPVTTTTAKKAGADLLPGESNRIFAKKNVLSGAMPVCLQDYSKSSFLKLAAGSLPCELLVVWGVAAIAPYQMASRNI